MSINRTANSPEIDLESGDTSWARVVVEKLRNLRYGSIHIKVHEAQVVLIETTEQTRFELASKPRT